MNARIKALLILASVSVLCIAAIVVGVLFSIRDAQQINQEQYVGHAQVVLDTKTEPLIGTFNNMYAVTALITVKRADKHVELVDTQISVTLPPQWQNLEKGTKLYLNSCSIVNSTLVGCVVEKIE